VVHVQRDFTVLGGAGNVARNILSLGSACSFITLTGNDEQADRVHALLDNEHSLDACVLRDDARVTTVKTRFIASGQQLLRVDEENNAPISPDIHAQILELCSKALMKNNICILSDYAKGLFNDEVCQSLIGLSKASGVKIIVDPKGRSYERYRGATLLTPNIKELGEAVSVTLRSHTDIVEAGRMLCRTLSIEALLVTQGPDGMTLITLSETHHIPTEAREVFDVSGAGDTVVATLAVALSNGSSLFDAACLANKAAGIVVGKSGTATVTMDELRQNVGHGVVADVEDVKKYNRENASDLIKQWRRSGLKVGFTNGCFDLLHRGHVHILKNAAAECDRLVVGLNSDASVRRLKGPTRPVHDEQTRADVLAALSYVDCVIIFDEETPLSLIETLEPDVLIKGADYTVDRVVGASFVQSKGGCIVLVPLLAGHSTTSTVARIGNAAA
jgi:D-beta-D-heptose 7-phosphate kinase/D-beta-D-heptose 1-phosphate adenosyltransferase